MKDRIDGPDEVDPDDVELFTREGIEDELLYAMAFRKAYEFDRHNSPSSILENEPEFVATTILGIALTANLDPIDCAVLRDIHDALIGRSAHRLKIVGAKPGRTLSGEKRLANENAGRTMLRLVDLLTEKMGKREAAISAVSDALKMSRATIFAKMKVGRESIRRTRELERLHTLLDESGPFEK